MNRSVGIIGAMLGFAGWVHAQAVNPTLPTIPANNFNVLNYGAVYDGKTDNFTAISNAIVAAAKAGGGTIEFPAGTNTYLSGPITLVSSIRLQVDTGAELQMTPYLTFPGASNQFLYCKNVHDVEIDGGGVIDGQGQAWWTAYGSNPNLSRPLLAQLYSVNRLYIHNITFQNPPYHHIGIRDNGGNVTISNLTESAPSTSPNTDGIDFVATNSVIENCHINVGDDNIAMGSTGPLVGLVISNCVFSNGHGVSVGSGVTDGISNVTVINCSFNGTVNGIRMKCDQDAAAIVTNMNYLNIAMTNVQLPICIWTYYDVTETPTSVTTSEVLSEPANPINSTTPRWGGILISNLNIVAGASSKIGGILWGPVEWPFTNVTLMHVTNNGPTSFQIYNAYGVNLIDSQFNITSGSTFSLCNGGLTVSNSAAGASSQSVSGATSANRLALYSQNMSMTSPNLLSATPVVLSNSILTDSESINQPSTTTQNFDVGTGAATIAVGGNLTLNSTLNIAPGAGFTTGNYTLFTYTGSLSGTPVLGSTPTGFEGYSYSLNTSTPGQVILQVSPPSPPTFSVANLASDGLGDGGYNIVLGGSGGVINGKYYVLTSTNVTLPLDEWSLVATNFFNAQGNFTFTNQVQTGDEQRYFQVLIP
jgi:hypothetical protein